MKTKIFHILNAGLYLWDGKTGLLIDALFKGRKYGMSDTPEVFVRQMECGEGIFSRQNDLLFTHWHEDHYDYGLVKMFRQNNPECKIYGPDVNIGEIAVQRIGTKAETFFIHDYQIYSFSTIHDGEKFKNLHHSVYLIGSGDEHYLICADAIINDAFLQMASILKEIYVDVVFVNLYQLHNPQTLEVLKMIRAGRIILYHLPLEEDDVYCFHKLAKDSIRKAEVVLKRKIECMEPMEYLKEAE